MGNNAKVAQRVSANSRANVAPRVSSEAETYDVRFRQLMGREAWAQLPELVQLRFSKRLVGERIALYPGIIRIMRFSRAGWWFAQLCRLIGGPLPFHRGEGLPAAVAVTEDAESGGQCWTRTYARRGGFPQVIHSAKRFAGETGLEEYIGSSFGMALRVDAVKGGLEFVSDHYFFAAFGRKLRIPDWLAPGKTTVRHIDQGEGAFVFSLKLEHALLGELVYQQGVFYDV